MNDHRNWDRASSDGRKLGCMPRTAEIIQLVSKPYVSRWGQVTGARDPLQRRQSSSTNNQRCQIPCWYWESRGYITTLGSKRMREGESGLLALQSDTFWLGVAQRSSLLWALYPTCLVRRREVELYSPKNSG